MQAFRLQQTLRNGIRPSQVRHALRKTGLEGFGWDKTRWPMVPGILLRRHVAENWFAVILRVGCTGDVEQALRFEACGQTGQEMAGTTLSSPGRWTESPFFSRLP